MTTSSTSSDTQASSSLSSTTSGFTNTMHLTSNGFAASFCSATMGSKIFLSICPLLLCFGTCTNIFSLLVLSRKRMRKHSTYVYLAILSVIDLLALWLGLMRDYLAHGYGIYIKSMWLCKLHSFLFYYTLDLSSWVLVAVSLDRFLAITFVFSSYTRKVLLKLLAKPKLICCVICSCLLVLNLHLLFYVEIKNQITNLPLELDSKNNTENNSKNNNNELISEIVNLELNLVGTFENDTNNNYNNNNNKQKKNHNQQESKIVNYNEPKLFQSDEEENIDTTNAYQTSTSGIRQAQQQVQPPSIVYKFKCSSSELAIESKSLIVMPYELSHQQRRLSSKSNTQHSIGVAGEYLFCVIDSNKHPTYMSFFLNVWPYIDLSAYAILPFCIMFICNIAIIKNVKFSTTRTLLQPSTSPKQSVTVVGNNKCSTSGSRKGAAASSTNTAAAAVTGANAQSSPSSKTVANAGNLDANKMGRLRQNSQELKKYFKNLLKFNQSAAAIAQEKNKKQQPLFRASVPNEQTTSRGLKNMGVRAVCSMPNGPQHAAMAVAAPINITDVFNSANRHRNSEDLFNIMMIDERTIAPIDEDDESIGKQESATVATAAVAAVTTVTPIANSNNFNNKIIIDECSTIPADVDDDRFTQSGTISASGE
jgi:hypothetical protein